MRISELTTRSAKLNTGTAYFPVDQSSDTVTNKIDYAELAKQIITEYNAQTLAGAAQSVKAALDTIGAQVDELNRDGNYFIVKSNNYTAITAGQDLNDIYTTGLYYISTAAVARDVVNCPSTVGGRLEVYPKLPSLNSAAPVGRRLKQRYIASVIPEQTYERGWNGSTWSSWELQPTRAEVDTITDALGLLSNEHYNYDTGAAGTYEYTLEHSSVYLICLGRINASVNSIGLYLANPYPTGNGFLLVPIVEINPSFASVSLINATLTITVSSNYVRVGITKIA